MIETASPAVLRAVMRARAIDAGERIREERIAKGWGPTHFCALIGVPLQTLHKVEVGEIVPRDYLKAAIALALDIDLAELYRWPTNREIRTDVRKRTAA